MQTKSLFVFAILLAASPSMFACTVTDGADESDDSADAGSDEGADDNSSDDTADEGDDTADEGDDTADESDETATTDEDGGTEQPEGDGGDVTEPEGDGGASDSDGGDETTEEGDGGADETTEEGDGGGEEPEGDAAAPSGDTVKSGSVSLTQLSLGVADLYSTAAFAGFNVTTYDGPLPEAGALPCVVTTEGSCSLSVCDFSDLEPAPEGSNSTSKAVSAGDVTIAGLSEDVVLSSDDNGSYATATGMSRLWEGGETVIVSAPGSDDVPEFSVELTAPSGVSLTSPEIDPLLPAPVSISRADSFDFAWSEGEDGLISVTLSDASNDAELTRSITCSTLASAGGVTIDASLLEGFSDEGAFSVSITATGAAVVEDWTLSASASSTLGGGSVEFTD